MKTFLLFSLVFFLNILPIVAQDYFEGEIVYKVELSGEGADQMAPFMPESYSFTFKESSLKFAMNGGITAVMMGDFIIDGENNKAYMVQHSSETAFTIDTDENDSEATNIEPSVTKENEVISLLGYNCQKYTVTTTTDEGDEATQRVWITDGIKLMKMKNSDKMMGAGSLFLLGIEGFPLRIVTESMGVTMTMEVSSIKKFHVDPKTFEIPPNYQVKPFDLNAMMGGGN